MKKLTDDWKIKKRKSTSCSFKESIDFKLTSPDRNHSTTVKQGLSATPKNVLKLAQTSQNNDNLRRSTRLSNKCSGTKEIHSKSAFQGGVKSFLSESVTQASDNGDQKHKTKKKLSRAEDDGCNLSQWGLPPSIVQAYHSKNINSMFKWQYECLLMKDVLDGGNLVFSAPTSAGKTLVAEILMLKSVTETKKKAIMILPFVSVVREKVHYFQEMFENAGIVVDGYMGAHNPPGGFKSVDIAICTMEKANNLVNRLMEERRLGEVGILVVDELHMLGDHGRGYLLELLLTKLLYNCKKNNVCIQIVGMSATLPNLDVLAYWLSSELYHTDFRPVPLQEMVKVGSVIYDAKSKASSRDLKQAGVAFSDDADHTIFLSIETITSGHGVLIFCPSKNWCENLATNIAKEIYNAGRPRDVADGNTAYNTIGEKLRKHLNGSQLNDIIQQLKSSPAGLDSVLGLTVPFGVAFHHAGLTFDERDIIEGAFRQGIIKILVATSTLSSGVNLPARRVIIRSPLFCGSVIDVLSYKQMVGRAGRKGIDDEGESILICKESERNVALTLVSSELRPVKSCLLKSGTNSLHSSLKRAFIEIIASGVASTQKEVLEYVTCTLLYASLAKESESSNNSVESSIEKCIEYLVDNDIIFKHEETENEECNEVTYKPSRLGLAILASGFSPDDALRVLKELQLARRCFVLENDLHILYEVTPPYLSEQMGSLNWMHFLSLWEALPEEYRRVGELVGVQESFIGLGIQGRLSRSHHTTLHKMAVHQRFYATLALNDLIQEVPLPLVAKKYDCTRGVLQSLQQSTSTFAGMLTTFCNRLGWHNLELLFSSFQKRVHFGIQQELCDLVRLSTLNAQRARALYNAGFESVASLASASADELAMLLLNMGSFESAKQLDGALAEEALKRHEAKRIRITGKAGVNEREAAHLIIQEAQNFIQQELGISGIHWKHKAARKFEKTSESNIHNQSTSSTIGTNPQTKCRQTAALDGSAQNHPISSESPIVGKKLESKYVKSSNQSRASNENDNTSEKSDEILDLENYPEILRKIYTEEICTKKSKSSSLDLSIHEEVLSGKSAGALLNDTSHETCDIVNEESVVFSGNILNENVNLTLSNKDETFDELDKKISLKPMNQTFLLIEDLKENLDTANDAKNDTVTVINESFYSNFDEKFCSFEETQKSCPKLEIESSLKEAVDNASFNELLLSQTANADYVYFTESFNICPNQKSDTENVNDYVLPAAIEHTTEATDCVIPYHNNDVNSQCLNSFKKSANKCSFLDVSELNFMSESCFSFELQNSLTSKDYLPEKISTPISEIKSKAEQSLFISNSPNKNFNKEQLKCSQFKEKSSQNTHSTPVKSPNNDSFGLATLSEILLPVISKSDSFVNNLRTSLPKVKVYRESSLQCEKENSINETSGDIFETEESFIADCVSICKPNMKVLSNSKISDSFDVGVIKAENSAAETSGDIFEDSFDDHKVQLDVEANMLLNQNISTNNKVKDTLKKGIYLDTKQIENISEKIFNTEHIPCSDALSDENHRKEELADIQKDSIITSDIKIKYKVFNTSFEEGDVPLLNTKDQSQFWNSWNPSQETLLTPQPAQKSKNNATIKYVPDIPTEKTAESNEDLTLDSADNSLFNSFNSDCLSPTPDKSSKSLLKIQVPSHRISSGFLAIPKAKETLRTCKNKELFNKENISPNNKENKHSQKFVIENQIMLKVLEISDADLEAFFKRTAKVKKFALAVACEEMLTKHRTIGPSKNTKGSMTGKHQWVVDPDIAVVGLAICYGKDSFYISCSESEVKNNNPSNLTSSKKSELIQQFFNKNIAEISAYDTKNQYKILWRGCNIPLKQKCMDPTIAAWLLDPAKGQQPLKMLVNNFWPEVTYLMEDFDYTSGSLGLQHWNTISGKQRASLEAFISFHLMEKLLTILKEQKLFKAFNEIEMPSLLSFAKMEQNGLGFNTTLATNYQKELQKKQQDILDKAYQVAGRRFNILSSREVSKILFKELKLSPVLAPDSPLISKHLGAGRSTRSRRMPPELKTNKECLEKILHLHPLPKAILDWRRLSFATTKVLMPLLKEHKHDLYFNMDRLYSNCYYYTLTGRVNVHSPNLQFVPRDFNIDHTTDASDNVDDVVAEVYHCPDEDVLQYGVSMRNLFIPSKGNVLLAADYTQLELRILAHLSNEKRLLESLNSNEDVFKNIAAKWKNISITSVSNEQRQQAKKICYGMIYGMSANSLSQQLNTTKDEANVFMETFKKSYPGLNKYFQSVIAGCQEKGYVTTLMHRRRYLPMIKSQDKAKQAHAGRQAINTTIQGSAADIIKTAMIRIEKELQQVFPETSGPYSFLKSSNSKGMPFRGGFLVLQMHDELIYEVCKSDLQVVLGIVREAMENTTRLTVKLPVQVRCGTSWGCMKEIS